MSQIVSTKDESVRLFKSNFCEFFTRVHWSVPLILYVPLVSYCLWRTFTTVGVNGWMALIYFSLGCLVWSLLEYILHRFLFHFKPKRPALKRIFYMIHEVHHEYPNDSLRLVMPPVESVPLAILLYFGLSALLPETVFFPGFAGLVSGYLAYDMIHYSVHHLPLKGWVGQYLKRHHLRHHFSDPNRGYGVSSPWWDFVFRTAWKREKPAS